ATPADEPTSARYAEGNGSAAHDSVGPAEAEQPNSSKPTPIKRAPPIRTLGSKSRPARQTLARNEPAEEPAAEAQSPSQTMASLLVESVPAGQVRLNGKVLGSSPVKIRDQRPGEVRVEVFNPTLGFAKEQVFSIAAGDNGTRRIVVARASLEFRVRPYATVLLDGKALGQTPFPAVQVYEGKHKVKLVNRELGKEVSVDYVVKPGQPNIFKYNLGE
ncbi:MAG TPA: PEGA domain-containing protein, partial [Myxococcaceae bacterium]|nr:PEGA domain-containing protein [Myxococcaceae bacterium]